MSHLHYGWIKSHPRILYHVLDASRDIGQWLTGETVYRVCQPWWHMNTGSVVQAAVAARERRPNDVFFFLLNEEGVADELATLGLPAYFIHQNAFLDETKFLPDLDAELIYDAVITARLVRFKRLHLARLIPRPLLISSVICEEDEVAYGKELGALMPGAVITGEKDAAYLGSAEIVRLLNQSKVGLMLSGVEGGNYATTEYLLCGLPVVSTGNIGGRNEWLNPDFCRVVPPDPHCIAAAVAELAEAQIDPMEIRSRTLATIARHRQKFCELGQRIYNATGTGREFARDFYADFSHKLGTWDDGAKVMDRLEDRTGS